MPIISMSLYSPGSHSKVPSAIASTSAAAYAEPKIYTTKLKKQLDDKSIWTHEITLEDMNSIKNGGFEYENSCSYNVNNYDMTKLAQSYITNEEQSIAITVSEEQMAPSCDVTVKDLLCEEEMLRSVLDHTFQDSDDSDVKDKDYVADFGPLSSSSSDATPSILVGDDTREQNVQNVVNVSAPKKKRTSLIEKSTFRREKNLYPLTRSLRYKT